MIEITTLDCFLYSAVLLMLAPRALKQEFIQAKQKFRG